MYVPEPRPLVEMLIVHTPLLDEPDVNDGFPTSVSLLVSSVLSPDDSRQIATPLMFPPSSLAETENCSVLPIVVLLGVMVNELITIGFGAT